MHITRRMLQPRVKQYAAAPIAAAYYYYYYYWYDYDDDDDFIFIFIIVLLLSNCILHDFKIALE